MCTYARQGEALAESIFGRFDEMNQWALEEREDSREALKDEDEDRSPDELFDEELESADGMRPFFVAVVG